MGVLAQVVERDGALEFDFGAILIALKVGERVVKLRRTDPPRLSKIVPRTRHRLAADRKAAFVGAQDSSRRYAQHQIVDR